MSMDITLYTAGSVALPDDLPEPNAWKNYGDADWFYETDAWQVLVALDSESEIPEEALDLNRSLRVTIPITLEPIGAEQAGYDFLDRTVAALAERGLEAVLESPAGFHELNRDE